MNDTSAPLWGQVDFSQVERFLAWIRHGIPDDSPVNFRAIRDGAVNLTATLENPTWPTWVAQQSRARKKIYVALNELATGCTQPASNANIARRRNILIDCDPIDEQHGEAAQTLADSVQEWLSGHGLKPLRLASGKGQHLYLRTDLEPGDTRVKRFLQGLAARFDRETAKVDRVVHDAPRITKLPGCPVADDKLATLIDVPDPGESLVSSELLDAWIAELPAPSEPVAKPKAARQTTREAKPQQIDERHQRFAKWLAAIPLAEMPRSGHGGQNNLFRLLAVGIHDFALDSPEEASWVASTVNSRQGEACQALPNQGYDVWDRLELSRKVEQVLQRGPGDGHTKGGRLLADATVRNFKFLIEETPAPQLELDGTDTITASCRDDLLTFEIARGGLVIYTRTVRGRLKREREDRSAEIASYCGLQAPQVRGVFDSARSQKEAFACTVESIPECFPDREPAKQIAPLDAQEIACTFQRALSATGELFAVDNQLFLNASGEALPIPSETQLFALLSTHSPAKPAFDWKRGDSLLSKSEFVAALTRIVPRYEFASELPHFPPMTSAYYLNPQPAAGDGKALDELVSRFSLSSACDYRLLKSLIVTLFAGLPPGKRPIILLCSDDTDSEMGRGVGKTTMIDLIAKLANGSISHTQNGTVDELKTRLLSPDARDKRIVLWDNVKSERLSNGDFEALVTDSAISGRRLYCGEGRVPNIYTFVLTMNGGGLSKDFAQRCVIIKLMRPRHGPTWRSETERFIRDNRDSIIADCRAVVERAMTLDISDVQFSRWAEWERSVLAGCVGDASELRSVLSEISLRQSRSDGESGDIAELRSAFHHYLEGRHISATHGIYQFLEGDVATVAQQVFGERSPRANLTKLGRYRALLPELRKLNDGAKMVYFWIGAARPDVEHLEQLGAASLKERCQKV